MTQHFCLRLLNPRFIGLSFKNRLSLDIRMKLVYLLGAIFILRKGKGVGGGIAKYLLSLTGVGGWFWIILT